jgi:TRAP-type C4-dicarboxylate transport system permease small subunit
MSPPPATAIDSGLESATRALHAVGAATIALLTIVILYDALGRLLFNRPSRARRNWPPTRWC